jgi:hypothetical protein
MLPNVIIDDIQKKMDNFQANLSKTPNIPIDLLESVTKNAANLQKIVDTFEKRMVDVMATLENISKPDQLVVNDLVVHQD